MGNCTQSVHRAGSGDRSWLRTRCGGNVSQFLPILYLSIARDINGFYQPSPGGWITKFDTHEGPVKGDPWFTPSTSNSVDLGYPLQTMRVSQNVGVGAPAETPA